MNKIGTISVQNALDLTARCVGARIPFSVAYNQDTFVLSTTAPRYTVEKLVECLNVTWRELPDAAQPVSLRYVVLERLSAVPISTHRYMTAAIKTARWLTDELYVVDTRRGHTIPHETEESLKQYLASFPA